MTNKRGADDEWSKRRRKWTEEEEQILIKHVTKNSPTKNWKDVAKNSGLGRSVGACQKRWYELYPRVVSQQHKITTHELDYYADNYQVCYGLYFIMIILFSFSFFSFIGYICMQFLSRSTLIYTISLDFNCFLFLSLAQSVTPCQFGCKV